MFQTTDCKFLTGLIIISKGRIIQLAVTNVGNTINVMFINKSKAIEKISNYYSDIDNIIVVNINSTKSIKISQLTLSKNML